MKKILIPVDFSETSENALFYTMQMFSPEMAEITVMHTYDTSSPAAFHLRSMDRILKEDADRDMEKLLNKINEKYNHYYLSTKVLEGDAVSIITGMAKRGNYDLIIMGTKGASGLKEVFIGSVAGNVISKSEIPVYVIPTGYTFRPVKEIVVAISKNVLSDFDTMKPLREFVRMAESKIDILHLTEYQNPPEKYGVMSLEDLQPSYTFRYCERSIDRCINDYLEEKAADTLCLVRSKKDFFSRLITGSVTRKQTFHCKIPILILQEKY